jgi:hypothetical protein
VHVGHGREERRGFKGYSLRSIKEACARYLPVVSSAPPRNGSANNELEQNQSAPRKNGGADEKSPNRLKLNRCRGGADEKGGNGQCEHVARSCETVADGASPKIPFPSAPGNRASRNWRGRT